MMLGNKRDSTKAYEGALPKPSLKTSWFLHLSHVCTPSGPLAGLSLELLMTDPPLVQSTHCGHFPSCG